MMTKLLACAASEKKLKKFMPILRSLQIRHFFTAQIPKITSFYPKQYNLVPLVGSPRAFS